MYAIVRNGSRQEKVAPGTLINVDLHNQEVGSTITLPAVLVVDGATVISDATALENVTVTAEVVGPSKGPKIRMIHYKNKSGYRRRIGHRQHYTSVKVTGISA